MNSIPDFLLFIFSKLCVVQFVLTDANVAGNYRTRLEVFSSGLFADEHPESCLEPC